MQISLIRKNKLERTLRIDSEYYQPKYLAIEKAISRLKNIKPLTDLCRVSDGNHTSIAEHFNLDEGVPYYRGQDITNFFLDNVTPVYIPRKIYESPIMKRSHYKSGDVLLSIVGTIGNLSLVTKNIKEATGSCKIAILRPSKIEPEYLATYLMSKYGNEQIKRNTRGAVQTGLILEDFNQIIVLIASNNFQNFISKIVRESVKQNDNSMEAYEYAEQILLSELELLNWKPKHCLSFVRKLSDTAAAGRIDAEYFQPKYDVILGSVKKYSNGFDLVGNLFKQNRSSFKNKPDELYRYVEISSVNTSSGEIEPLLLLGKELPANAKIKLNGGDLIISKVRTYRGAVAIVQSEGFVGSGAFTVLEESENINKETAYVFFKSDPVLKLSLKYNAGTSYPVIDDKDILNLPCPLIPEKTQRDIKQKITEMYVAKALSKRLLEIAKRGVEMAIEKDETTAEHWINKEMKKLGLEI
ncbi:MAG: hypothetical protein COT43_11390 [Candidatus Marinimicrobia bacterium CG08_land_8_20_14_0_20_45_22]|nr:MAG: hypothetical protein COT43_11390 [Candidatus Marinimicrobia bacterium CG08_land_8_20_14_0_20_45_22]